MYILKTLKNTKKFPKHNTTQFQIEGGGLVQGVTKLITILLTIVTLNKNYANRIDKKWS